MSDIFKNIKIKLLLQAMLSGAKQNQYNHLKLK